MSTVLVRRKERRKPPEMPRGEILPESPPELPEVVTNGFRNVLTFLFMAAGTGAMSFMFLNPNSNPLQMGAGCRPSRISRSRSRRPRSRP